MESRINIKNMPLVSICIITFNQVKFIRETIESALDQDYENTEIVVADDGSTDGTKEIILDYAEKFPEKIIPVLNDTNLGITENSNRGLLACRGKYVAFLGGDDSFLPNKITRQVEWLEVDEKRVLCYHDLDVYDSDSGKTLYSWSEKYKFRNGNVKTVIKYGTFFGATSVMIRYPESPKITFNKNIPVASDWFMWIEILEKQSGTLGYINGIYARYRRHKNNITSIGFHHLKDALTTINAVEAYWLNKYRWECRQKRAEVYFLEAYKNIRLKNFSAAFLALFSSLRACNGLWISPACLLCKKIANIKY